MERLRLIGLLGLGLLALVAMPLHRQPVELLGMAPPTLPASMADRKSMFSYLKSQSWTPADEQGYLASRLGLPVDRAPAAGPAANKGTQNLHATSSPAKPSVAAAQEAAGARRDTPEHAMRLSVYNVPYFSAQLHPEPLYRRNGMHAAAATYSHELQQQGIPVGGGSALDGNQDRQLAEELSNTELAYSGLVERDPNARPAPPHLGQAAASQLAQGLEAGERYALLPNHGRRPAAPRGLPAAEARRLAQQLGDGERYAEVGAWTDTEPAAAPALDATQAQQLARQLEQGERFAQLPNHGVAEARGGANHLDKAQMRQQEALAESLERGEEEAQMGGSAGDLQRAERHAWGVRRPGKYAALTAPQAQNLHSYLKKGLRQVFGSRHVAPPTYVTEEGARQLEKGYREGERLEAKLGERPRARYEGVKEAMKMSNDMQKDLAEYHEGQGHYVHQFLRQVEGAKYGGGAQALRQRTTQDARNRALGRELSAGIDYVKKAQAVGKEHSKEDRAMSMGEIKALGSYLKAPYKKVEGQATAMRYAV